MNDINIVLVEPEIPQNTGNIARTCAATGASLHLVKPLGFEIDDRKLKRAGLDYWDKLDITYYESLDDFFCEEPGRGLLLLHDEGSARIFGYKLPEAGLPDVRQGDKGTSGGASFREPGQMCPHTHARHAPLAEPVELRRHRGI